MNTPLIRSIDIAEMANVSRAAVTQWRKRHNDFPAPVADSDPESPLFDRSEIERWLVQRGRQTKRRNADAPTTVADIAIGLRRGSDATSDPTLVGAALVLEYLIRGAAEDHQFTGAAAKLNGLRIAASDHSTPPELDTRVHTLLSHAPEVAPALAALTDPTPQTASFTHALSSAVSALAADQLLDVYDLLLTDDRRQSQIDPEPLAGFIADLFDCAGTDGPGTVFDPVVGPGAVLLTIGLRHRNARLIGVDVRMSAHRIALQRAILANRPVDLRVGNSLGEDPASEVLADAVVATPPWGMRDFGPDVDLHSPRWAFGRPSPRSDGIWLQHAVSRLADGGRAFVVTPRGELFRSGPPEALRHELLRQGAIEAIIALPPRLFSPSTSIATALWVLCRPGQTVNADRVLLIDIPETTSPSQTVGPEMFDDALAEYRRWRTSGEVHDTPRSIAVRVRDLLDPRAGLNPTTWIERRDAAPPHELIDDIVTAHGALAGDATAMMTVTLPSLVPAGLVRRDRLTALPGITLIRSRPSSPHRTITTSGAVGSPLLTGQIFRDYTSTGVAQPDTHVTDADLPAGVTTRTGDIVIAGIARTGKPVAVRFDEPGWVVPSQFYVVRIDSDHVDAYDRDYLVASINANTYTQSLGTGTTRVIPTQIEVPVIDAAEQRRIGDLMRSLTAAERATARHLSQLRHVAELVRTATGTGAVTIAPDPHNP